MALTPTLIPWNPQAEQRDRRHQQLVASLLNSLILQGILTQTGFGWTIASTTNVSGGGGSGVLPQRGADGNSWLTGAGAPSRLVGHFRDLYFDTVSGNVYQKQGASPFEVIKWIALANLRGGKPGKDGVNGKPGAAGPPGTPGAAGPTGPTGATGGGAQFTAFTTPPLAANWTTFNMPAGSTLTDTAAGLCMQTTGLGTGEDTALVVKSIPAAPYTITAALLFYGEWNLSIGGAAYNSCAAGLAVKNSGGAGIKLLTRRPDSNPQVYQNVRNMTAHNTAAGSPDLSLVTVYTVSPVVWIRIKDDNTNRTYAWSSDGVNFIQGLSEARATTFTPDQIGLCLWSTGRSNKIVATFVSYQETQP